jgi:hypothetical protein
VEDGLLGFGSGWVSGDCNKGSEFHVSKSSGFGENNAVLVSFSLSLEERKVFGDG